ncbi:MAG: hypothetical protein LUG83_05655 [Lachnospiraceae bacterium]|nr:hypothetical protein [Lachnospiraceae bacterium]
MNNKELFELPEYIQFMQNAERMEAEAEVQKRKKEVKEIAKLATETILVTMPPAISNLQQAYEKLIAVEAKIEDEIIQKRKKEEKLD